MPQSVIDTLAPVAGLAFTLSRLVGPAVAYAKTKDSINAATLTELDAALERELRGQSVLLRSHDFKEGATAFQQRRTPNFTDH